MKWMYGNVHTHTHIYHTHTHTHTKLISLKMFHSKDTTLLNMFKNKSWPGAFTTTKKTRTNLKCSQLKMVLQ